MTKKVILTMMLVVGQLILAAVLYGEPLDGQQQQDETS